jgi:23S rRNA pseudouridine1911/1915/1917 synthase
MSNAPSFCVDAALAGAALPAVLRASQPGMSWSQVKQLIRSRRVLVNDTVCLDEGRRLRAGETVRVTGTPQKAPPSGAQVVVRHLDRHLVVVEKPAGMRTVSHREDESLSSRRRDLHPTLEAVLPDLIAQHESGGQRPALRGRKPSPRRDRLRVVHRIDRETSGLLVFARTPEAESQLVQQFKAHTIDRIYLTIVAGHVEARTFSSSLVDDRGDGRRGSTTLPGVGKRAVTHVRPLELPGPYTLLECRLETGRTHQIRIHLSEAGHPVCGDKRYHQPLHQPEIPDRSGAPRLALHAARLGFPHPVTGEELSFEAPLPEDLTQFLERLRKQAGA